MATGNETRLPKAGEVWVGKSTDVEVTILWGSNDGGGRVGYWWEEGGTRRASDLPLDYFLSMYEPKPEPIPGPDEVWLVLYPNGGFNAWSTLDRAERDVAAGGTTAMVRYMKADPQ